MDSINIVPLLLQIIALVLLFLAGINKPSTRFSLGWFGMFFWLLSLMVTLALHPAH